MTGVQTCALPISRSVPTGTKAGSISASGYVRIRILGTRYMAHRLAWLHVYGVPPAQDIDHINRVRSDNRIQNLRLAFAFENKQNQNVLTTNTSGVTGVRRLGEAWAAFIGFKGVCHYLGSHKTFEKAVEARLAAERKLHKFFISG